MAAKKKTPISEGIKRFLGDFMKLLGKAEKLQEENTAYANEQEAIKDMLAKHDTEVKPRLKKLGIISTATLFLVAGVVALTAAGHLGWLGRDKTTATVTSAEIRQVVDGVVSAKTAEVTTQVADVGQKVETGFGKVLAKLEDILVTKAAAAPQPDQKIWDGPPAPFPVLTPPTPPADKLEVRAKEQPKFDCKTGIVHDGVCLSSVKLAKQFGYRGREDDDVVDPDEDREVKQHVAKCPSGYELVSVRDRKICLPPKKNTKWTGGGVKTKCTPGERTTVRHNGFTYHLVCK